VDCLEHELSEATGMTSDEMDTAAGEVMTSRRSAGAPATSDDDDDEEDLDSDASWPPPSGNLRSHEFTV